MGYTPDLDELKDRVQAEGPDLRDLAYDQVSKGCRTANAIAARFAGRIKGPPGFVLHQALRHALHDLVASRKLDSFIPYARALVFFRPEEALGRETPLERHARLRRAILAALPDTDWLPAMTIIDQLGEGARFEIVRTLRGMAAAGDIALDPFGEAPLEARIVRRIAAVENEPGIAREQFVTERVDLGDTAALDERILRWIHDRTESRGRQRAGVPAAAIDAEFDHLPRGDRIGRISESLIFDDLLFQLDKPKGFQARLRSQKILGLGARGRLYLAQHATQTEAAVQAPEPIVLDWLSDGERAVLMSVIDIVRDIGRALSKPAFVYIDETGNLAVEAGWGPAAIRAEDANTIGAVRGMVKLGNLGAEEVFARNFPDGFFSCAAPALWIGSRAIHLIPIGRWTDRAAVREDYALGGIRPVFLFEPSADALSKLHGKTLRDLGRRREDPKTPSSES